MESNKPGGEEKIKKAVRQAYGDIARRFVEDPTAGSAGQASCCNPAPLLSIETAQVSCCGPVQSTSCCGPVETAADVSAGFYSGAELDNLPASVTAASLGGGNPTAIAELQPGEVVLDLGSGGGIDCFLAAKQVGPEGRVIGLDMTPDMIKLARKNAKKIGAANIDFRYGEMEEMPLPDESVDVIISNCVINLSPDKDAVFAEAYRVLRPGGRMMVSDMVVDGSLPNTIRKRLDVWTACVAGALDESVYLEKIRVAGFEQVDIVSRAPLPFDLAFEDEGAQLVVVGSDSPVAGTEATISLSDLAEKVASVRVKAYKPA